MGKILNEQLNKHKSRLLGLNTPLFNELCFELKTLTANDYPDFTLLIETLLEEGGDGELICELMKCRMQAFGNNRDIFKWACGFQRINALKLVQYLEQCSDNILIDYKSAALSTIINHNLKVFKYLVEEKKISIDESLLAQILVRHFVGDPKNDQFFNFLSPNLSTIKMGTTTREILDKYKSSFKRFPTVFTQLKICLDKQLLLDGLQKPQTMSVQLSHKI